MRKVPDAYTALCGILLPLLRNYAEISNFLHTVIWCHLCVTMRKIAGAYASTCVFHIMRYTVLYHCCGVEMRYYAEK